jgi:hypothetical protein
MFDKRLGWRLFGIEEEATQSVAPSTEPRESRQMTEGERGPRP